MARHVKHINRDYLYECSSVPGADVVVASEALSDFFGTGAAAGTTPWSAVLRVHAQVVHADANVGAFAAWAERVVTVGMATGGSGYILSATATNGGYSAAIPTILADITSGNVRFLLDDAGLYANSSYLVTIAGSLLANPTPT